MKRLYVLTFCAVLLAVIIHFCKDRSATSVTSGEGCVVPKEWLTKNTNPATPEKDRRPADQTFLTYPEWFLVFSPEEQADYFKKYTSSSFPFMDHIAQFWESYKIVNEQISGNFPPNTGYHFMIWVIGVSTTVEYSIKAWYETIVGRVTDTREPMTEEDKFNAKFTNEYVRFIKDRPWYEFDFKARLKDLWSSAPFFGEHWLRKIERRYILTSELLVKYGYGKLIGMGTRQVYDAALPTTAVVLENDSLVYLPRYDKFAGALLELAKSGHTLKEVTGNTSAILLTILVPADSKHDFKDARVLFEQRISSDTKTKRMALVIPVKPLSKLLLQLEEKNIKVEHVFDF